MRLGNVMISKAPCMVVQLDPRRIPIRISFSLDDRDIGVPLKDIDWIDDKRMIKLKPLTAQILRKEIDKDLAFFDSNRIIDYSFLIGYAPGIDINICII